MRKKIKSIPRHVAIIMDGNRRWAKKRGLPIFEGHRVAAEKVIEPLVEKASQMGVSFLTLWAFSTENWQRDRREVEGLLKLFRHQLAKDIEKLHQNGVRILVTGDRSKFPEDIQKGIKEGIEKTKNNKTITVVLALNYGGRDEIIRAIKKMAKNFKTVKQFNNLTIRQFSSYLDTADIPEPDLIIRTGGEKRLSGFLLWQSEYSELYFTDVLFPDFTPEEFEKAILEYQKRQRRFGR